MNKLRIHSFILFLLFFTVGSIITSAQELRIISYNVENLFDCQHDTLKNDSSFLPDGMHHWNYYRYHTKLDRIAQVIVNIAGWESVPLVGLCEVENAACLSDLCHRLKRFHYRFVHYESADERGIDVALLYDSTKVKVLNSRPLYVDLKGDKTRDVLYACCLIHPADTLHVMVCHLPSKSGGAAASQWKRDAAKEVIQQQIDSILHHQPVAKIVVMGDMNCDTKDDLQGMSNLMIPFEANGEGTHKYRGVWSCLDQFYVSTSLTSHASATIFTTSWIMEEDNKYLDDQPKRTYIGYRYHGGYSDHLPIVLHIAQ